jgi:hypothetical protein
MCGHDQCNTNAAGAVMKGSVVVIPKSYAGLTSLHLPGAGRVRILACMAITWE